MDTPNIRRANFAHITTVTVFQLAEKKHRFNTIVFDLEKSIFTCRGAVTQPADVTVLCLDDLFEDYIADGNDDGLYYDLYHTTSHFDLACDLIAYRVYPGSANLTKTLSELNIPRLNDRHNLYTPTERVMYALGKLQTLERLIQSANTSLAELTKIK